MFDLSIVIPCYNEEKRLPSTLREVGAFLRGYDKSVEIIVVDDGSKDNTVKAAESVGKDLPNFRVLKIAQNHGKGYVVQQGMLAAQGKHVLFMDADHSTPIAEIEKLWPYVKTHEVIIGSRHMKDSNVVIKQPWYRIAISRTGNFLIQALLVKGVQDTQCGFKLFSHEAAQRIFAKQKVTRFGFDIEILAIAQKIFNYRIKEVPVSWYNSLDSRFRPVQDAVRTLKDLFRITLNLMLGRYGRS